MTNSQTTQEAEPDEEIPMGTLIVRWLEGQTLDQRLAFFDEVTNIFCPSCGKFHPSETTPCTCM